MAEAYIESKNTRPILTIQGLNNRLQNQWLYPLSIILKSESLGMLISYNF